MEHQLTSARNFCCSIVGAILALSLTTLTPAFAAQSAPWNEIPKAQERSLAVPGERLIVPQQYRTVGLDWAGLNGVLLAAPVERSRQVANAAPVLSLPLADGSYARFRIEESPMIDAALAARLPDVKTYRGVGIDDPSAFVRFDTTPAGFHAMILSDKGTVFIDPYARGEKGVYLVYDKRHFHVPASERPVCRVGDPAFTSAKGSLLPPNFGKAPNPVPNVATSGGNLKTIRLAVAATGEYTGFHGGSVAQAQAAIVTTMNRVNTVYEHDLAIRMNLVDNTTIVFTNPANDPYTNSCSGTELGINQTTIDNAIGATNYDLGHVVGGPGGGGGLAGPGPCLVGLNGGTLNNHARGCTGSGNPVGDPFDIDFVAHELGHQWGAPHTFNGSVSNCGGNGDPNASYEPGSGSTIMAYAGICGSDNLQPNSDPYFHGASLETIAGYDPTVFGGTNCIVNTPSGNTPPTAGAGLDRNIPRNTPFTLCGTGTDPDVGDNVTYLWEEFDLGPAFGPPNNPNSAPFFRSFIPTASSCRTFPMLNDILTNTQTNGEILPNVAWPMTFRLTVFDNHAGAFGGGFDQDEVNVTVNGTAGPFLVTSPNTAVNWTGGTQETVTWDVAGTNAAPISCANVDILFSTDGGQSFPTPLANGTANDGTHAITVPNGNTTTARVKVECSGNVFFDISNANFSVGGGGGDPLLTVTKDGTGAGTVTSAPAGIDCGLICQATFPAPTVVTLTATAAAGSTFATWGGACAGSGAATTCPVTMDQARNVSATFNLDGGGCQDDAFETTGDPGSGGGTGTDDLCYGTNLGAIPAGPQTHLHCDEDWVYFPAEVGKTYRIETSNLVGGSDTFIHLQLNCGGDLATDDDSGTGVASAIEWTATTSSPLDVRIWQFDDNYVPGEGYDISVSEVGGCPINLNLVNLTVNDAQTFIAQAQITTGPSFLVSATGNATLTAGTAVVMANDTSIAGQLTVNLTPNPCPGPREPVRLERRH